MDNGPTEHLFYSEVFEVAPGNNFYDFCVKPTPIIDFKVMMYMGP